MRVTVQVTSGSNGYCPLYPLREHNKETSSSVSLYSELKRRGVLQAGIAYTVFMWLQIQALYTAHSGNSGEAIILADRAIDLSGRRPKALFFAALT